ncbi:metalloregulator ArsR/SmtB family transcription factor [Marivirga atlantica]|jgi:predicted transcriptional regulator|uniref:Winged helix-turn-helix transcriptional regulator n=1 Tax=Marivirga atlantica TaxID=1548457 RepID=A0A937AG88_9BACT|nr:metalloregulator ArsR/SmtB family transcription factor [Marivirga atlantica]MBL0765914.1 winged helix-turn-helix transcriptional regulator [Marivirga atlantica]
MGVSRTDLFSEAQNNMALAAKAFAHPARVAIIEYLLKASACINGDLVNELGLAQATISQHLRELKEIGIIKGTIEGTRVSYCINSEKWELIKTQFSTLFNSYNKLSEDNCC